MFIIFCYVYTFLSIDCFKAITPHNWKQHLLDVHNNQPYYTCFCCKNQIPKTPNFSISHVFEHDFILVCTYCKFCSASVEDMQAHVRDIHATKLAYALKYVKCSDKAAYSPTVIVRLYKDSNEDILCHPALTENQINYMKPSLSEFPHNAGDVPSDNGRNLTEINTNILNVANEEEKIKSNQLWKEYKIQMFDDTIITPQIQSPIRKLQIKLPTQILITTKTPTNVVPSTSNTSNTQPTMQDQVDAAANAVVNGTGLESGDLYRCGVSGCNVSMLDEKTFQVHLIQHKNSGYPCYHCRADFVRPVDLKNHISCHGIHRFFCFYCNATGPTFSNMKEHALSIHKDNANCDWKYLPLNETKMDQTKHKFVVCPRNVVAINDFTKRLVERYIDILATKKYYAPEEANMLPPNQIFVEKVYCKRCHFGSKVRQNVLRHLQMNTCVPSEAPVEMNPVNPVPCLQTGERQFDKMRNLALSSNSSNSSEGSLVDNMSRKFVPEERRYKCGARGCEYHNISPDIFSQHIDTLHASDEYYQCPHCNIDLMVPNNTINSTEILDHMRFHDSTLFKCPMCDYYHYARTNVDKHIAESHPRIKERALRVNRDSKKIETPKPNKSTVWKFKCNICLNTVLSTRTQIKQHLTAKHRLYNQYQCLMCAVFSSDQKTAVKEHLTNEHNVTDVTNIRTTFDRVEGEADNSPIWRRDDPTRVSFTILHNKNEFNFNGFFLFFVRLNIFAAFSLKKKNMIKTNRLRAADRRKKVSRFIWI